MPHLVLANQHPGPLPLSVTFKAPSDGPATLTVHGSVWSATANTTVGIRIELDGVVVGQATLFSNQVSEHRAVVPAYIPVKLAFGSHTVSLQPLTASTTSDVNDYYTITLDY